MTAKESIKLLVLNFHTLASRNLLTTDVANCLSLAKNVIVHVVVPDYKVDFYKSEFSFLNFNFIGVNVTEIKSDTTFNTRLAWIQFHLQQTEANENRLKYYFYKNGDLRSLIELLIHKTIFKLLSVLPGIRRFLRWLDLKLIYNKKISSIFNNHYDAIYSTDIFGDVDCLFGLEANRRQVPYVGMVRSWDNPTSKGILRATPGKILVNNEWIKTRISELHSIPLKSIEVVGSPQFDRAFCFKSDNDEFRKKYGIPAHKKIVLFGCSGYLLDLLDSEICQILQMAKDQNLFHDDIIFLIRPHPSSVKYFEDLRLGPDFILIRPGQTLHTFDKNTEFTVSDQVTLMETLANADVMVFSHTTLSIDALPFDLPEVVVCFPGLSPKNKWHYPLVYHNEEHFKRFMDTEASKKVFNSEELIYWINNYLGDRSIDKEKRKTALTQEIYSVDGNGGKNTAQAILNFIS